MPVLINNIWTVLLSLYVRNLSLKGRKSKRKYVTIKGNFRSNWFRSLLMACSLARYNRGVQYPFRQRCEICRKFYIVVAALFCSFSSLSEKCISTPAISYHNTTNKNNRARSTSWIKCLVRNHLPRPTEVCRRLDSTQQHELESKAGKIKR